MHVQYKLYEPHQGIQHNTSFEKSSEACNKTIRARRNTISAVTAMSHLMYTVDDFCSSDWVRKSPQETSSADTLMFTFTVKRPRETFFFFFFFSLTSMKNKSITLCHAVPGSVSQLPVTSESAAASLIVTRRRAVNLTGVVKHEKARRTGKKWHNQPNNSYMITRFIRC